MLMTLLRILYGFEELKNNSIIERLIFVRLLTTKALKMILGGLPEMKRKIEIRVN